MAADEDVVGASRSANWSACSAKKTMEVEILKEALDAARVKKPTLPLVSWKEDASR